MSCFVLFLFKITMMFLGWGGLRLRPSGLADIGAGTCSVGWEAQKGLKLGQVFKQAGGCGWRGAGADTG